MTGPFDIASTAKAIHASIDDAFAAIPEGRTHVLFFDATLAEDDSSGARVVYAQKTASGWGIVLQGAYDQPHGISGHIATAKSW